MLCGRLATATVVGEVICFYSGICKSECIEGALPSSVRPTEPKCFDIENNIVHKLKAYYDL